MRPSKGERTMPPRNVSQSVAVADPAYPERVIKPNADGSVNVVSTGSGGVGLATEATLEDVLTVLETPAAALPQTPLLTTSDLTRAFDDASTVGEDSLVSASALQTTRGYIITVTSAGAGYIELRDGSAGTALMRIDFPAAGGWVFDLNERPWVKTTANTALYWYRSAAVAMTIDLRYVKSA